MESHGISTAPQRQSSYARLEAAGQLQLADSPQWVDVRGGATKLGFYLPRQGVSLMELGW
jgi:xylan 1,4-beta-xylosidase